MANEVTILWRLVAVSNGSKIPLFDFFSTFVKNAFLVINWRN